MDFFDILLAKKLEDDRDPKVEGLSVTANGTYSEDGVVYKPVVVNVPETPLSSLAVTANGTYTAPAGTGYNEVSVNVPAPANALVIKNYEGVPTSIASFSDGTSNPLKSLTASIVPVQDLHGYDSPWVGGGGKNKLPMTIEGIKAVNTYHSWSGNSTTINNVTITIETDENNNVTGIKFNGTASADITFNLATNINVPNGSYKWSNDQIVNVSNLWLSLTNPNVAITLNAEKEKNITIDNGSIGSAYIYASSGNVFNNIVFKPMIRLASVSDATFAPYSNICSISGWTEANVTVSPTTDAEDGTTYTIPFTDSQGQSVTVYGGTLDVTSGVLTVDRAYYNISDITFSESGNYYKLVDNSIPFAKSQLLEDGILSHFNYGGYGECIVGITPSSGHYIMFYKDKVDAKLNISSVAEFNAYLQAQKTNGTPVQLAYKLATPTTFYTQPTSIKSLDGVNNVFASTGDVEELKYFTRATS